MAPKMTIFAEQKLSDLDEQFGEVQEQLAAQRAQLEEADARLAARQGDMERLEQAEVKIIQGIFLCT